MASLPTTAADILTSRAASVNDDEMPSARLAAAPLALVVLLLASCQEASSTARRDDRPTIDLLRTERADTRLETRRIELGKDGRGRLLEGWSSNQWNRELDLRYVWAIARDASLRFRLLDPRELQFLVTLAAFPSVRNQHVTVLVNDRPVAEIDAEPFFHEYRFVVPADALRLGGNTLTFRHDRLAPRDDGHDSRQFAAAYSKILIGPNCLPLRPRGEPPPTGVARRRWKKPRQRSLVVTGPAELSWRLTVPPAAELHLDLAGLRTPALFSARIRSGEWVDVAEARLGPSLFARSDTQAFTVDLSRWTGQTVDLLFRVAPESCRTALAVVEIRRAAIFDRRPTPGH